METCILMTGSLTFFFCMIHVNRHLGFIYNTVVLGWPEKTLVAKLDYHSRDCLLDPLLPQSLDETSN